MADPHAYAIQPPPESAGAGGAAALLKLVNEAKARTSPAEVEYEIWMAVAESVSKASPTRGQKIRQSADSLLPLFGRSAAATWSESRSALPFWRRMRTPKSPPDRFLRESSLEMRRATRAAIQAGTLFSR